MFSDQINKLIYKTDFYNSNDNQFVYICYNRESKNIIKLKKLIEDSNEFQWWDHDDFSPYNKYTIVINTKPVLEAKINI